MCPSASVRAWLRALRAGPRHPQLHLAKQKRPCSTVVVRCSCCATLTTLPTPG